MKTNKILNKYIFYFFIYSFLGWFIEHIVNFFAYGRFIDSNLLFGPFSPLYGFGLFIILFIEILLRNFKFKNRFFFYLALFIFASISSTIIELITGIFLDKIFGVVFWSYSSNFLKNSFSNFICLPISICWGILSLIIIKFIHPKTENLFFKIPNIYISFLIIYFFIDLSITLSKYIN